MQKVPSKDRRKLLPRWRPLSRVPKVELASATIARTAKGLDFDQELVAAREAWRASSADVDAIGLVEAASVFGEAEQGRQAASHLLEQRDLRPLGQRLARGLLGVEQTQELSAAEQIRQGKKLLEVYPRNAVLRSQMALAYVTSGQRAAAQRQMDLAVKTAPTSRFVLRSAARFYVHDGDPDQAYDLLSRNADIADPWIMATLTSLSDLVNKPKAISGREIRRMLSSGLHPDQLVELAVAFATLEISHGAIKPGRKLINEFREHLNENAAAQIKWIEEDSRFGFDIDLGKVENSFEASALSYHNSGHWNAAVQMTERWFDDEPFSKRAAILGSYISSAYADNQSRSIDLIDRALVANPNDISLLNNRAFALAQAGDVVAASEWLNRAKLQNADPDSRVVLGATEANIMVRSGLVLQGLEKYALSAIDAVNLKLFDTRDRMIAHWFSELYRHGYSLESKTLHKFTSHYRPDGPASSEARRLFNHIARPFIDGVANDDSRPVFQISEDGSILALAPS